MIIDKVAQSNIQRNIHNSDNTNPIIVNTGQSLLMIQCQKIININVQHKRRDQSV